MLKIIRKLAQPLSGTPFHPQWLINRSKGKLLSYLRNIGDNQIVLDAGCFNKWPKAIISSSCSYIGLDYYVTAKN